ncbi:MAG: class I SAM-dependent methyltransferase [Bullifex sp.]
MDTDTANSAAWDEEVRRGSWWSREVTAEETSLAEKGKLSLPFLPDKALPETWLEKIGEKVLLLASGGGQQGPLLSAYGKNVTVMDISAEQLKHDEEVAMRDGLSLKTVRSSMAKPFPFADEAFDTCINPVSVNFIKDPLFMYREVRRVLKKGGYFMTAFANPALYMFDVKGLEKGKMKIKYTLPFDADISLSEKERMRKIRKKDTLEYSHTLTKLIGGLTDLGFTITGFDSSPSGFEPVDSFLGECYLALIAIKS